MTILNCKLVSKTSNDKYANLNRQNKTASVEVVAGFVCLFVTWGIYVSVCAFILHAAVQRCGKPQKTTSGQKIKDETNTFLTFKKILNFVIVLDACTNPLTPYLKQQW